MNRLVLNLQYNHGTQTAKIYFKNKNYIAPATVLLSSYFNYHNSREVMIKLKGTGFRKTEKLS
jgi:hypothetical protein